MSSHTTTPGSQVGECSGRMAQMRWGGAQTHTFLSGHCLCSSHGHTRPAVYAGDAGDGGHQQAPRDDGGVRAFRLESEVVWTLVGVSVTGSVRVKLSCSCN